MRISVSTGGARVWKNSKLEMLVLMKNHVRVTTYIVAQLEKFSDINK